eukprot:3179251-Karenia_brevis.AAC.1
MEAASANVLMCGTRLVLTLGRVGRQQLHPMAVDKLRGWPSSSKSSSQWPTGCRRQWRSATMQPERRWPRQCLYSSRQSLWSCLLYTSPSPRDTERS